MDVTIDLTKGLADPAEAKKAIKKVQLAIDEIVKVREALFETANAANKIAAEYSKQVTTLTKTNFDLTTVLKSIHILFGQKYELIQGDTELKELANSLATFILSSGAIKQGVLPSESDT